MADLMTIAEGIKVDLSRSHRIDVTGSAFQVLRWVLMHVAEISESAIGAVVELVKIQLYFLKHLKPLATQTAVMLFSWLRQLDVDGAEMTIPSEQNLRRVGSSGRSRMIEQLRLIAFLFGEFAPDDLKAYLREIGNEQDRYKVDAIRQYSQVITPIAPSELAELVLASLLKPRKRQGHRDRTMEQAFTFADSNYLPPSPAQPPFLDLLESAPAEGLKLIRTLVAEAIDFSADARGPIDPGFIVDFGSGPRFFPRADSYLWSRDQCREYSAASGLMALEAWSQQRLDAGVPVNEVLADILGPEGSCAAYLLVAVDVLLSHFDVARDALAPLIADPELLASDRMRRDHDQLLSGIDRFAIGKEPTGKFRLADLNGRLSRRVTLFDVVRFYLEDDPVANRLREQLGAAILSLEPIQSHSTYGDARLIARIANNMLQRSNWTDIGGGKLAYRSPEDEALHLDAMEKQSIAFRLSSEIESRVDLAFDGKREYATASTARDAASFAEGDLPDDSDTDYLKSRSTRLIKTALLVARDGDDGLLAAKEVWVRQVVAIALQEHSDRRGSASALRYNRPAIAILTLIYIWARKGGKTDRDALVRLSTREDRSALLAFSAGFERILEVEPQLFKAAMRVAFAGMTWRWRSYDEGDEAEHECFVAKKAAVVDFAVAAEIAWMEGDAEPAWPVWPEERPHLARGSRIRVPGFVPSVGFGEEIMDSPVAEPSSIIHVDSQAAAHWLAIVQAASKETVDWRQELVEAYVDWTARMNGLGLPLDVEIDRDPHDWNLYYYALLAERLLEATDASFETDLKLVIDLPDDPFGNVAQTLILSADTLYFNDPSRPAARHVELRDRLAQRVMQLGKWQNAGDPASSRIDMQSGSIFAKIMLNTYDPFNGTYSYLPPALFDRVDPLLLAMRPLLPGGPTAFVARCTMNLLLVAPRERHLDFLLEATEVWFDRTKSPSLWIDQDIGRRVVQWLEVAIMQEPRLLDPMHPLRDRIDRALGRLVGVGVAEAHDLELKVEAVARANT